MSMFNYVPNKECYISFMDDNYLDSYSNGKEDFTDEERDAFIASLPDNHWYTFDKVKVFTDGDVEVIGAWFYNPKFTNVAKYIGEYTDGSGTIEFRSKKGDPILQWEGVITRPNGDEDIITYESSRALRIGYGGLDTGYHYPGYNKPDCINNWLARSYIRPIEGERLQRETEDTPFVEELFFLVESKEQLNDVASHYNLPVPYDSTLEEQMDNDLSSIRFKSVDLNAQGPGNFVAVVVAAVVFENRIPVKLRLYKTSRWAG